MKKVSETKKNVEGNGWIDRYVVWLWNGELLAKKKKRELKPQPNNISIYPPISPQH